MVREKITSQQTSGSSREISSTKINPVIGDPKPARLSTRRLTDFSIAGREETLTIVDPMVARLTLHLSGVPGGRMRPREIRSSLGLEPGILPRIITDAQQEYENTPVYLHKDKKPANVTYAIFDRATNAPADLTLLLGDPQSISPEGVKRSGQGETSKKPRRRVVQSTESDEELERSAPTVTFNEKTGKLDIDRDGVVKTVQFRGWKTGHFIRYLVAHANKPLDKATLENALTEIGVSSSVSTAVSNMRNAIGDTKPGATPILLRPWAGGEGSYIFKANIDPESVITRPEDPEDPADSVDLRKVIGGVQLLPVHDKLLRDIVAGKSREEITRSISDDPEHPQALPDDKLGPVIGSLNDVLYATRTGKYIREDYGEDGFTVVEYMFDTAEHDADTSLLERNPSMPGTFATRNGKVITTTDPQVDGLLASLREDQNYAWAKNTLATFKGPKHDLINRAQEVLASHDADIQIVYEVTNGGKCYLIDTSPASRRE